jgi:sterol desaturase/sphingolipid hydroxylase (fatty acid hydroxylase superfamily)
MFGSTTVPMETLVVAKRAAPVLIVALFWCWETWRPFFGEASGRVRHAAHNLTFALFNTLVLGLAFGTATVTVAEWTRDNAHGLLSGLDLAWPVRFLLALVVLDAWMYVWHRANHAVPLLWRFHRTHHSDRHMDVTTATRFHLGEHVGAAVVRLGLIPLFGFEMWHLIVYDTLVIAITMFHHADISLGRLDGYLRWVVVTPDMHKVHHSDWRRESDSNYSTVLAVWDRLAGSFRMRPDPRTLVFGLREFANPSWQSWWGMFRTPFVKRDRGAAPFRKVEPARERDLNPV